MQRKEAKPRVDQLRADPGDVRRFARRRQESERVGPIAKLVRYAVVALMLAGIGAAYWNWDTLRDVTIDFSVLTQAFEDRAVSGTGPAASSSAPEPVVVEDSSIVGAAIESRIGGLPSEAEIVGSTTGRDAAASNAATSTSTPPPTADDDPAARTPVVVAAEPEPPPGPEAFEFGLPQVFASEADASAAVIVLRTGDRRRVSSVTWSTRDGTASAGVDYADRGTVVERFAAGEQNRTLHIPLVGDRNAEGPESFYVRLVPPDGGETLEVEVVINDDD